MAASQYLPADRGSAGFFVRNAQISGVDFYENSLETLKKIWYNNYNNEYRTGIRIREVARFL